MIEFYIYINFVIYFFWVRKINLRCVHTSGLRLDLDSDWPGIGLWVAFTPDWPGSGLPRICDVRGQLYFNFCFIGAHCCPLVQWTTTSPWQPVHFQSEVSPIAFTFAWVRSEFFPSPPRLGGLKSCTNWVQIQSACVHTRGLAIQIQSKSSPSPLVWTHL